MLHVLGLLGYLVQALKNINRMSIERHRQNRVAADNARLEQDYAHERTVGRLSVIKWQRYHSTLPLHSLNG